MDQAFDKSVTQWIADLKVGDPEAAHRLSKRYFDRLVQLARKRLGHTPRRVADEEDVALSVFKSLCLGAARGHYPQLENRDDLWPLLLTITHQKVVDLKKYVGRKKRGGGQVRGESVFFKRNAEDLGNGFDHFIGEELTPEHLTALDEQHQRLLGMLRDDTHRNVALWRMEGYSNQEIADKLGIGVSAVERKLRNIRAKWSEELAR